MKHIFVEFTTPKNSPFLFLSKLIRWVQNTPYSHVRLRWVNTTGRNLVYEASGNKVQFIGELAQENYKVNLIKLYQINITYEQYRGLIDLCMKYAGVDYGFLQLIGIGLVQLFSLKSNPLSNGVRSQVCSELVGRFLEEVLNQQTDLDLDIAGPKELDLLLTKLVSEGNIDLKEVSLGD